MSAQQNQVSFKKLPLLIYSPVHLKFSDQEFKVDFYNSEIKIALNETNFVKISLKNQQVAYKTTIMGGFVFSEDKTGEIDYKKYFLVHWVDDLSLPELIFNQPPLEIKREYRKGQKLELGIEDVARYYIVYKDKVTAEFVKTGVNAYDFSYSTGFWGSLRKESDGTHTVKFKGLILDAEEDNYKSESKFIISRSKYTDNLILILQDDAVVYLS